MREIARLLLEPKRILALVMLAVVNLALFSGQIRSKTAEEDAYREQMLQWGITLPEDRRAEEDAKYINEEYPAYLSYIQTQSQTQSILQKLSKDNSPFVTRNLEKTVQDYQALGTVEVVGGDHRALDAILNCSLTDILLLFAPILLVLALVSEADTAVGALIRTTKHGRTQLCAWRILALILFSFSDVLLLYGGDFCYAVSVYGSPNLLRPIQSVPAFQLCAMRLSVGGYLVYTILLKTLAVTVISLLLWLILSRFHPLPGWMLSAFLIAAMWLCHQLIMPTSPVNHLRFLNPFAALQADEFFTGYCNLNLFEYPVVFLRCMLFAVGGFFLLLMLACLFFTGSRYPKKRGAGMVRLFYRIVKVLSRLTPRHTVFGFEGWKLLIAQRALIFVFAAIGGAFWLWKDIHISVPISYEIEQLYKRYEGEITQEKLDDAAKQVQRWETAVKNAQAAVDCAIAEGKDAETVGSLQTTLSENEHGLALRQSVQERLTSLSEYTARTGRNAWFVRQDSYQLLFRSNAMQRHGALILLLYLIFAFSGVFAFDRQYDTAALLKSTKNGRFRMRLSQWIWIFILVIPAAVLMHGAYFLHLAKDVGFSLSDAPAQSVTQLQWLPFSMSIRTAIIGYLIVRCLAAYLLAASIAGISRLNRCPSHARMVSLAAFLLPSALCESGVPLPAILDFVNHLTVTV